MGGRYSDTRVTDVRFDQTDIFFQLVDGRTVSVPTTWYPRLLEASYSQRQQWEHTGGGDRVQWLLLGQEISVAELFAGSAAPDRPSEFFRKMLASAEKPEPALDRENAGVAFIASEKADALYEPKCNSAVRMSPQYGELVDVLEMTEEWACIRWFGMKGWVHRSSISTSRPPVMASTISHSSSLDTQSHGISSHYEVGPRGGLFSRTKSGFRRYL